VVQHPVEANRLTRSGLAAAAIAVALAIAGCGGDSAPADQGVGGNKPLQLADCDDWNSSSPDERLVTIGQLTDYNAGQSEEFRGRVLDEDQAYDVLDGQCEAEFAGAFKLYKLYGRAAAFLGH
jgi:hypothetical protein